MMDMRRRRAALFVVLILPCLKSLAEDDTDCLKAFRESVTDSSNYLASWNFSHRSSNYLCNFVGVTCWNTQENKVLALKLPRAGLSGRFPSGLNKCSSMQTLDLSQNELGGTIPDDICSQLPYATILDLSDNHFTGSIPSNLQDCMYLNVLHLQHNQLSGFLPSGIGNLPRLREVDVSDNMLSGSIPSTYSNIAVALFKNNSELCGHPLSKSCSSGPNVGVIVGASVAVGAILACASAFGIWWLMLHAKKRDKTLLNDEYMWVKRIRPHRSAYVSLFEKPIRRLKLGDLMAATADFNRENIIGSGRTGTIYKAFLSDGSMLAVKRLSQTSLTDKQFATEINTLGKLRHSNIVPLLGYCCAGSEKFLVYKHMVNGSLGDCLHEMPEKNKPNWPTRLKIGVGAARGFAWLHHSCNPRIIHSNISGNSILLDEDYDPRITDAGLAQLLESADANLSSFANAEFHNNGYVPPELSRSVVSTVKGDVYSFGVVLLELVTGQRASDVCAGSEFKGNLAEWVAFLSKYDRLDEAVDMSLKGRGNDDELDQFLKIASSCVLSATKDRPTMYEVYRSLRAIEQKLSLTDNNELPHMSNMRATISGDEFFF
ncbi:hypothetical protein KP509_28G062800 [Ceratopteris richardii]|uniref:Protein kinase domain-containing protein n=1 Tax=Ceratopteris richardii TaxID=49495 RepID=A0A8T2REG4_CERRI|nr:hypothetical protein KP509_28G062800 [Ceratopteris richardii]KAH7294261.1 hypothetical protein KP509_28G062800 [Ceratopteris richardii]